jgi:hypothetical protein
VILDAQKILAQLFFIELIGRRTVECAASRRTARTGILCASAEPAKLQIARYPLSQAPAATQRSQRTTAKVQLGT